MMKLFLAGLLALAGLAVLPEVGRASGNEPYSSHGYGWLQGKVFRHMQWIHSNGPLYNYGPYMGGPGYTNMHIPEPYHGSYMPANYGLYGPGAGAAGYGYPGYAAPQPQGYPQPQVMPQQMPAHMPVALPNESDRSSRFRLFDRNRVTPVNYAPIYPNWMNGR